MITITVPIFNVAEYLDCCVESIVNQTYRDIEIILVDDGSTDGSQTRCDLWAGKDQRIKVVHQKNMGLYMARKTGAKNATGEYVLSIDADDWLDIDACEKIAKVISDSSPDIIQYGLQVECDDVDNPDVVSYDKWFNVSTNHLTGCDEMLTKCYIERKIPWNIATKVIRTSIINKAYDYLGDYRINQLEDFLTSFCVFLNSEEWHRIEGKFYHYRYGTGMSTTKHMSLEQLNKKSGYIDAFEGLKKKVLNQFASTTIAFQLHMNEMSSYIREERDAQLQRNGLYPQCRIDNHKENRIYRAILSSATNFDYTIAKTIAIHLHISDYCSLSHYRKSFNHIPMPFDLYISLPKSAHINEEFVLKEFSDLKNVGELLIKHVPDRSGDIMPVFSTFNNQILKHNILLHLHTKENRESQIEYITSHLLSEKWIKTALLMLSEDAGMLVLPEFLRYRCGWHLHDHLFWTRTECLDFLRNTSLKSLLSRWMSDFRIYRLFITEEEVRHSKSILRSFFQFFKQ